MDKNKTLLVELRDKSEDIVKSRLRLEELEKLSWTLGSEVVTSITISISKINPATLIGKGKVSELKATVEDKSIDLVIFDTELSPTMQRNLEELLNTCVIDRREVIIQIFADRAATKEAKLQVKLAQNQYSMNRLSRRWVKLSQQRGGVRGAKGEGEKQIELDRRTLQRETIKIKKELIKVKQSRKTQQKNRISSNQVNIALVGYTNSGKSSLLKALSQDEVFTEDKLFATLDPLTRQVVLPSGRQVLISDTVGLINNLPHFLIEAFSSTLEEAKIADIIIVMLDASHPDIVGCYNTTMNTLENLEATNKPIITVINKIDLENEALSLKLFQFDAICPDAIRISIKENKNINLLLDRIEEEIENCNQSMNLHFTTKDYKMIASLRRIAIIVKEDYKDDDIFIEALVPFRYCSTFAALQPTDHKPR